MPEQLPDHIPPSRERDQETLKLVQYLFTVMVKESGNSWEESVGYLPEYFLQWVESKINTCEISQEVIQEAGCQQIGWDFLKEILSNAAGVLMLAPLWPYVTLAYRGSPKHKIAGIQAIYYVTWEDGTICPLSSYIPAIVMEGGVINDAFAAAQMIQQFKGFQKDLIDHGLDGLHDRFGKNFGGEHPYNVLMGAFLKIIPQLDPALREHMKNYHRLIQAMLSPPLPPALKARLEQRQRDKSPGTPGVTGGFG